MANLNTLILTEKPSVAADLAAFLKAQSRRDGYFEGNGYCVTWAFGHLVSLFEPQDYKEEWRAWRSETLPILPVEFQLKQRKDQGANRQLATIGKLLKMGGRVICATDAGREGELIFRNILRVFKLENIPFDRLWLSSLTEEAIRDAFAKIKPGIAYDDLYHAARCRSEADWIVGMNGTRCLTIRYGKGHLWSMGRVQTPVLAMVADRDDEIAHFCSEPFFELYTKYREAAFKYNGDKFSDQKKGLDLLHKVEGKPFTITDVQKKPEKVYPPLLYDLTELQREMNRRYGLSAADTLTAAQSLYEAKLITYPRTDSQYLPIDMREKIPPILRALTVSWSEAIAPLPLDALPFSPRIINDKKVSDHHAIIPTGLLATNLSEDQRRIFEAVVLRLIVSFYPPCEKSVTTVIGKCEEFLFQTRGVMIIAPGWTKLEAMVNKEKVEEKKKGKEKKEKEEVVEILPLFLKGESGEHAPYLKEGKTTPPKHYTENTILGAMATAGRLVKDQELREALKEKGLGTPATRAAIIETLIQRNYLQRNKKNLLITEEGRYLIAIIPDSRLKSATMTGNWEFELKEIERGRLDAKLFMTKIVDFTCSFLQESDVTAIDRSHIGPCPLCQSPIVRGKQAYGCSKWKEGCTFVFSPQYKGITFHIEQVQRLLQRKVLLPPITLSDGVKVILALTSKGKVIEVPFPKPIFHPKKERGDHTL